MFANRCLSPLLLLALGPLASASQTSAERLYVESDGLVVMELENTESDLGLWRRKTSLPHYTGRGYLEFTGNNYTNGNPKSPLTFSFKIHQGGTYLLDLRCAKIEIDGRHDWANDCYIRVTGDFTAPPGPHDFPGAPASLSMLKTDLKYFGGRVDDWEWASRDATSTGGRLDPGGKNNKRQAIYQFKRGGVYTLTISGRSKAFRADRVVFRHASVPAGKAQELGLAESQKIEGEAPVADDLDQPIDAAAYTEESHPSREDIVAKNSAHDVSAICNGSWIKFKDFDFGLGHGSSAEILASCSAVGGFVELRTGSATGPLLGTVAIKPTWGLQNFGLFGGNLQTASGMEDLYLVFRAKADERFRLKNFKIKSGETVENHATTLPIDPPAGRLAIVADGNSPDPDDIGATAFTLAILRATGLEKRLVHCSHSCDLVKASNISNGDELRRQQLMQAACDGAARRWGGFEELTFWNCRTQQAEAVRDLRDAINDSQAGDPLWIVEAGEPDVIGYALEMAEASKRKHVRIITHHPANDRSGDYYKWKQIVAFGVEIVRIPDQNGATYARLSEGLQRPLWAFDWARDHEDSRVNWLWEQIKIAEQDDVVRFQKNKGDISDTGMVIYWITGANVNGGYRTADIYDVWQLFSGNASESQYFRTTRPGL